MSSSNITVACTHNISHPYYHPGDLTHINMAGNPTHITMPGDLTHINISYQQECTTDILIIVWRDTLYNRYLFMLYKK